MCFLKIKNIVLDSQMTVVSVLYGYLLKRYINNFV